VCVLSLLLLLCPFLSQRVNIPPSIQDRVTFHPLCIGKSEERPDLFMELTDVMAMLNHSSLSFLKVRVLYRTPSHSHMSRAIT